MKIKKEEKKEVKQETKKTKVKIYEIPEQLFKQVKDYMANSKSDYKTADVVNLTIAIHSLKPIEKEFKQDK